jgi:HD superfamily phosphodiesterase
MNFTKPFKKYDYLGIALKYIIDNSTSNYGPYHNLNHTVTVTRFAIHIGESEKLNEVEMKELLIAAIFHDYNHTLGDKKDDVNVRNAQNGVEEFVKTINIDVNIDNVKNIIAATQFPYVIEESELNLQQQIMRDCDMCQLFESNRLQFNYLGLQKEIGIDFKSQLDSQESFYDSVKFRTNEGKRLWDKFSG